MLHQENIRYILYELVPFTPTENKLTFRVTSDKTNATCHRYGNKSILKGEIENQFSARWWKMVNLLWDWKQSHFFSFYKILPKVYLVVGQDTKYLNLKR